MPWLSQKQPLIGVEWLLGRTLTSRKRRAETKRLHRSLSTPHIPNADSNDLSTQDDNEDIEDSLNLDDPEVCFN